MTSIRILDNGVRIENADDRLFLTGDDAWLVVALALAPPEGLLVRTIREALGVDIRTGALRQRLKRLQDRTGLPIRSRDLKPDKTYSLDSSNLFVDALRYLELTALIRHSQGTGHQWAINEARSLWSTGPPEFGKLPNPSPEQYDKLYKAHTYLQGTGKRILIVDDQVGDLLAARLRRHDCRVAHSLDEFEWFRKDLDQFDLAVIDLHLTDTYADSTGDVIVRDINSQGLSLPVIMITLSPPKNRSVPEWIKSLGLVDVIFKEGDELGADMAFVAQRVNELLLSDPAERACDQLALKVQSLRRRAKTRLKAKMTETAYKSAIDIMEESANKITRLAADTNLGETRKEIERFIINYGE
jgi:hypothetical protein